MTVPSTTRPNTCRLQARSTGRRASRPSGSRTASSRRSVVEKTTLILALCALSALVISLSPAEEIPEVLTRKLAEFKGAEQGQISGVTDDSVTRQFPGYSFYVLRFRHYPVAHALASPLRANNLFVLKPDHSVELIADAGGLEQFFRLALTPVTTEPQARDAARAWLRLAQEFHQDGFFQFSIPGDSVEVASAPGGGLQVKARASVNPPGGNAGEITASLVFDQNGRLARAAEAANFNQGIRPICQATRLLDPDPIVRLRAEQDLLAMGMAAKGYLDEQRARAGPDLRQEIDRIW